MRTTAEVAAYLRVSDRKVRKVAAAIGAGLNVGGRAGYRYDDADVDAIKAYLRPEAPVERKRRRRGA